MLITYKGCTICTRHYTVHSNHSLIGKYKTLPAAKAAATREDNRRKAFYSSNKKEDYDYDY